MDRRVGAAGAIIALLSFGPVLPGLAQEDAKTCRFKTKTMGCTLESGVATLEAGQRAAAAAATVGAGGGGGKCEIDSPGITPNRQSVTVPARCADNSPADDSDAVIDICKTASTNVFAKCKMVCAKLRKRDPGSGDPLPNIACTVVVDRSIVTTGITRTDGFTKTGEPVCTVTCEASIACVCDP